MFTSRFKPRFGTQPDQNRDRWLVSYSDFITLLFGFFVVMYAISSVNDEKYRVLSSTLNAIFESHPKSLEAIQVGEPQLASSPHVVDASPEPGFQAHAEGDTLMRTSKEHAVSELGGFADDRGVSVESNDHWLEISLDSEVGFRSGSSELSPFAESFLTDIAAYFLTFSHPITIEGYTDNVPSNNSNWRLSAARASAVAEFLQSREIGAERLSAVGYGENHPLATNATPEGRARNRRVVLVVAHNGNLPRNLNTAPETSAFAFVRHREALSIEDQVQQQRTADGGLLFTAPDSSTAPAN